MTREEEVCIFDNIITCSLENVRHWLDSPNFTFVKDDLLSLTNLGKLKIEYYSILVAGR
jgi:hypothetical protein